MENERQTSTAQAFATPELLEHILTFLLCHLLPVTDQEDPRSVRINGNAVVLRHLLHCSEVNRTWHQCIAGSKRLQRALYFIPDHVTKRSWDISASATRARQLYSYYTAPHFRAPLLNPVIQTAFPSYHFRFWRASLESTGNKHCAYLIITRRDLPAIDVRARTRQGKSISGMLLSQPPCTALEARIWEERDETREYVGRTNALADPMISCESGVTLGLLHDGVAKMFDEHRDVAAIKLTTI